jgi:hypothetical protein
MNKPTLRSVALTALVAACSMVALLVGLFTAGLIAGALSARNPAPKPVEIIRYVQRPASAPAPSASAGLMRR